MSRTTYRYLRDLIRNTYRANRSILRLLFFWL